MRAATSVGPRFCYRSDMTRLHRRAPAEGFRICNRCDSALPATPENFLRRDHSGSHMSVGPATAPASAAATVAGRNCEYGKAGPRHIGHLSSPPTWAQAALRLCGSALVAVPASEHARRRRGPAGTRLTHSRKREPSRHRAEIWASLIVASALTLVHLLRHKPAIVGAVWPDVTVTGQLKLSPLQTNTRRAQACISHLPEIAE